MSAAPETETDASGLTTGEISMLGDGVAHTTEAQCWTPSCAGSLPWVVERIVAERVRVVEGERDAARVSMAEIDAAEIAPCPCGHDTLDHEWHGCEECGCARSATHALLASDSLAALLDRERREVGERIAQAIEDHADQSAPRHTRRALTFAARIARDEAAR